MDRVRTAPKVGQEYKAFGQDDSPFRILEELSEEKRAYLIKNINTGYETYAFGVVCFSDETMEWERSEKGWFR